MGQKCIQARFHSEPWPLETVSNEQILSLGKRNVQFLETKMLHWPDSMVSYLMEDRILIAQDAFGQNIASSERFDDWIDWNTLKNELAHYYANIILPFSPRIPKTFEKIQELGWQIDIIAPDHGLILQRFVSETLEAYLEFAAQRPLEKAVICYDTMWKSTEKMAEFLASCLAQEGISVSVYHLKSWHHSDVMGDIWDSAAVLVGSATHNNGILPMVADMLTYMKGLRPQNKLGFGFGSYGWSGEAPKQITQWLQEMNMDIIEEPVAAFHVPNENDFEKLSQVAKKMAQAIRQKVLQSS
jgi:flavorubredoxin